MKKHFPRSKTVSHLAAKALRTYRLYRKRGFSPTLARTHAHFAILVLRGGRKNLFAENLLRRYPQ